MEERNDEIVRDSQTSLSQLNSTIIKFLYEKIYENAR